MNDLNEIIAELKANGDRAKNDEKETKEISSTKPTAITKQM